MVIFSRRRASSLFAQLLVCVPLSLCICKWRLSDAEADDWEVELNTLEWESADVFEEVNVGIY